MEKTAIIWTEKTWNPVTGCKKISAGCKFCYAQTIAQRGNKRAFPNGFGITYRSHKINDPYRWSPSLIFVNSMSDFFWDEIDDGYRKEILDVIRCTPQHEYQILTKRDRALLDFSKREKLPENFWAGVTVENKKSVERIETLKNTQAKIKFISFEPLLEGMGNLDLSGIDWAITGGESGRHMSKEMCAKRGLVLRYGNSYKPDPEKIEWIRQIRNICRRDKVYFFHKQWGGGWPEAAGRKLDGKYYSEIPKLPRERKNIQNDFLNKIEAA